MGLDFGECVRAHYEGETDLRTFFKLAAPVFEALGKRLMRHWRTPSAVDLEDVVQELKIGACWALKHYDPKHPNAPTVDRYVMFNMADKAKKWLHRQRGAVLHGNPDAHPGRYDVLFSQYFAPRSENELGRNGEAGGTDLMSVYLERSQPTAEPPQEVALERRRAMRKLLRHAPSRRIAWAIVALEASGGQLELAAHRLYDDVRMRLRLRLGSLEQADVVVRRAYRYMARAA